MTKKKMVPVSENISTWWMNYGTERYTNDEIQTPHVPLLQPKGQDQTIQRRGPGSQSPQKQPTHTHKKLGPKWEGPYRMKQVKGKGSYELEHLDGKPIPRTWHAVNLKKIYV